MLRQVLVRQRRSLSLPKLKWNTVRKEVKNNGYNYYDLKLTERKITQTMFLDVMHSLGRPIFRLLYVSTKQTRMPILVVKN